MKLPIGGLAGTMHLFALTACCGVAAAESRSGAAPTACTVGQDHSSFFSFLAAFFCCICAVSVSLLLRSNPRLSSCKSGVKKWDMVSRKVETAPKPLAACGNNSTASIAKAAPAMTLEQLVPEITHHALSYLDFKSLCSVSMTNSAMRRAANDDTAWKALFRQDFNGEQEGWTPNYGWKAHYAVTKAVTEVNNNFYKNFQAKSLKGMSRLWLRADYVKCMHPGGVILYGYELVMDSWRLVFNWSQRYEFELHDVRVRVVGDVAWVTVKEFVNSATEPLLATNCYEYQAGQWYIVHHHSSPQLEGGGGFG